MIVNEKLEGSKCRRKGEKLKMEKRNKSINSLISVNGWPEKRDFELRLCVCVCAAVCVPHSTMCNYAPIYSPQFLFPLFKENIQKYFFSLVAKIS